MSDTKLTVNTTINLPVEKVWTLFTQPEHIRNWYFASPDWHAPEAENDLRPGGRFKTKMAARDGSMGFDFDGVYTAVEKHSHISYELGDSRKVTISFKAEGNATTLTEEFDVEDQNSAEMQRSGWQAILDNFKKYAETSE